MNGMGGDRCFIGGVLGDYGIGGGVVNLGLALPLGLVLDVPSTMPRIPKGIVGGFYGGVGKLAVFRRAVAEVAKCVEAVVHHFPSEGIDQVGVVFGIDVKVSDAFSVGESGHMRWVGEERLRIWGWGGQE